MHSRPKQAQGGTCGTPGRWAIIGIHGPQRRVRAWSQQEAPGWCRVGAGWCMLSAPPARSKQPTPRIAQLPGRPAPPEARPGPQLSSQPAAAANHGRRKVISLRLPLDGGGSPSCHSSRSVDSEPREIEPPQRQPARPGPAPPRETTLCSVEAAPQRSLPRSSFGSDQSALPSVHSDGTRARQSARCCHGPWLLAPRANSIAQCDPTCTWRHCISQHGILFCNQGRRSPISLRREACPSARPSSQAGPTPLT